MICGVAQFMSESSVGPWPHFWEPLLNLAATEEWRPPLFAVWLLIALAK